MKSKITNTSRGLWFTGETKSRALAVAFVKFLAELHGDEDFVALNCISYWGDEDDGYKFSFPLNILIQEK